MRAEKGMCGCLGDERERRNIVIKFPSQNIKGLVKQFYRCLTIWTRFSFANRIKVNYRFAVVTKHDLLKVSHTLLGGERTINIIL